MDNCVVAMKERAAVVVRRACIIIESESVFDSTVFNWKLIISVKMGECLIEKVSLEIIVHVCLALLD